MLVASHNYTVPRGIEFDHFIAARYFPSAVPSGSSASAICNCSAAFSGCHLPHRLMPRW
jgi:hypothetical protein